ncbi:MAG: hypothetical protein JRI41_06905 [Deltaproteobacteria bacterium]|nr:hypothetical protein [Deltaproteobacteria bacterium]
MPRYSYVYVHYAQSTDADRSIRGVGLFPKGEWVEVTESVYDMISKFETGSGWKVKKVRKRK